MLRVVTVSSSFERANAERLASLIRAAWPGIDSAQDDDVTIAAGLKLVRESDLLVTFALDRPRSIGPVTLRNGTVWKGEPQAGVVVIECKALDASRLTAVGNDLRPSYGDGTAHQSVLEQLKSQVDGLVAVLRRYDCRCFVHGLAWMTGVSEADLRSQAPGLSPFVLGSDATWGEMLAAAAAENGLISEPAGEAYRKSVAFVAHRFTRERRLSARDVTKIDRFTTGVLASDVVDDVMKHLGSHQIRLTGRAGSGKSTTMAIAAARVVERDQARVLFLTYHKVLRGELDHLARKIAGSATPAGQIVVGTMHDFLIALYVELGGSVPLSGAGRTDWAALPNAVEAFIRERGLEALRRDAQTLRKLEPDRFDFDYVFIDEGQDWRPAERDLLRLLFSPEQTVISDGLDQFAQRQTRCDWTSDVDRPFRYVREMKRSLRMSANVAAFVTALARAMGFHDWRVQPHPDLTGGRVILARGLAPADLVARVLEIAAESGVSPGDCLVAVPPPLVDATEDGKRARIASELAAREIASWDATDDRGKSSPRQPDEVAIVPYASLRGLEGWATVLLDLDAWDDNRRRYPNTEADEPTTADEVAKRALLLAVTRAAHVLAITTCDATSRTAAWIEEASQDFGNAAIVERW